MVFTCSDWRDKSDDFGGFLDTVINEAGAYQTKDIEQLLVELVSTKEDVKAEEESGANSTSKDEPQSTVTISDKSLDMPCDSGAS